MKLLLDQYESIILFGFILLSSCSTHQPIQREHIYPVAIADVIQKDTPIFIETIGNVNTLQFVQIRPQVSGIIQETYVKEGQYVKKGDPLYQIDPRPYQANLEKAKAALIKDVATLQFNEERVARYKSVVQQDYLSKLDFHQFVSNVELSKGQILIDKADIQLAELNLEWTVPTSPIEGKVGQYNIDEGNLVVANDPNALINIRQITPADIRFSINQKEFIEVQESKHKDSLKFRVFLPQLPDQPREGTIYFMDNTINPSTGTILLKGRIPNEDELLWPGEFVRVQLELRVYPNALLVPEEAVKLGQSGPYIFVYNPETSTVEYRLIEKGRTIDHMVLIEKGISPGEKIVVRGQENLHPGSKVSIAPSSIKDKDSL